MKKILKALLEIIEGIIMLCWVLYSPIWMCMVVYNTAYYIKYGDVATPNIVIILATILFIINLVWLNHMIDKAERKEE